MKIHTHAYSRPACKGAHYPREKAKKRFYIISESFPESTKT